MAVVPIFHLCDAYVLSSRLEKINGWDKYLVLQNSVNKEVVCLQLC